MASEWREVALEELAEEITVGHVGPMASEYVANGIPFLRSQNVEPLRINDSDLKFISQEFHAQLRKSALSPGNVVIVRTGKPGACAVIPASLPVANCSDLVIVRCGPGLDPQFLAYYVNSVAIHHVNSHLVGAVQQHFNVGSARTMLVNLPEISEQRSIAHILGALDEKIELNRRKGETLGAMSRAIFQSWFADFDPVRAKAAGRDPGLPDSIAELFADSFEDSDLGEIPKGWAAGRLGDLVNLRAGKIEGREAVVLSAVAAGELVRSDDHFAKRVYSEEINKYIAVEQGDFAYNPSRINIGSVGMLKEPLLGAVSPVYVVFRPNPAYRWFVEFTIKRSSTKRWINNLASGSVRQSLSFVDFKSIRCVIPPLKVIEQFDRAWSVTRDGLLARAAESRTLESLRDALLPKLISGELRIGPAKFIAGRGDSD